MSRLSAQSRLPDRADMHALTRFNRLFPVRYTVESPAPVPEGSLHWQRGLMDLHIEVTLPSPPSCAYITVF